MLGQGKGLFTRHTPKTINMQNVPSFQFCEFIFKDMLFSYMAQTGASKTQYRLQKDLSALTE